LVFLFVGWYNNGGEQRMQSQLWILTLASRAPETILLMPVEGAAARRVANTWHAPRDRTRKHEGQDIFAPKGTPVRSAAKGLVVRIGQSTLGGNTVSVLGSGLRSYYYAHLDGYAAGLKVGQLVEAGELLGYVGNTGNARFTPPHLHFGVYTATGAINPLPLLLASYTHELMQVPN
jgi:murein DD-endopeptidase MepM/ murein hydrolase activator NlpD